MLMQQPIPVVFNAVQQQPSPQRPQQGTARQSTAKSSQQPAPVGTKHYCSTHLLSPHPFLRDPCGTIPQVAGIAIIPFPSFQMLCLTPPHGPVQPLCVGFIAKLALRNSCQESLVNNVTQL